MLSEHQLETIEKLFPSGCVVTWVINKKKPTIVKSKVPKFGIYLYNPNKNEDIESAFRLLAGPYLRDSDDSFKQES